MQIGYIGLGKMGANMVERLIEKGHDIVATDQNEEAIASIESKGGKGASSLSELVENLAAPRTIWMMVPWKAVDSVLEELSPLLQEGDRVIDGGNSPYKESQRRYQEFKEKGIRFMDIGVSGGPSGARNGACMMVGGDKDFYEELTPLFTDLNVENGFGYMGAAGAGHFVKMVHNGIEYGMMQAIGEGFEVMKKAQFDIDLEVVASVYSHGSVIESSLISWLHNAYKEHGENLDMISGEVSHSGEGQWTVEAAKDLGVPVKVIEESLQFRIDSEGNPSYTGQVVSALRNQFGGHNVSKE